MTEWVDVDSGTIAFYAPSHRWVEQVEAVRLEARVRNQGVAIIWVGDGRRVLREQGLAADVVAEFPTLATYSAWIAAGRPIPPDIPLVDARSLADRVAERNEYLLAKTVPALAGLVLRGIDPDEVVEVDLYAEPPTVRAVRRRP